MSGPSNPIGPRPEETQAPTSGGPVQINTKKGFCEKHGRTIAISLIAASVFLFVGILTTALYRSGFFNLVDKSFTNISVGKGLLYLTVPILIVGETTVFATYKIYMARHKVDSNTESDSESSSAESSPSPGTSAMSSPEALIDRRNEGSRSPKGKELARESSEFDEMDDSYRSSLFDAALHEADTPPPVNPRFVRTSTSTVEESRPSSVVINDLPEEGASTSSATANPQPSTSAAALNPQSPIAPKEETPESPKGTPPATPEAEERAEPLSPPFAMMPPVSQPTGAAESRPATPPPAAVTEAAPTTPQTETTTISRAKASAEKRVEEARTKAKKGWNMFRTKLTRNKPAE